MDLDDLLDSVAGNPKQNDQKDEDEWGIPVAIPKSTTQTVVPVKSSKANNFESEWDTPAVE